MGYFRTVYIRTEVTGCRSMSLLVLIGDHQYTWKRSITLKSRCKSSFSRTHQGTCLINRLGCTLLCLHVTISSHWVQIASAGWTADNYKPAREACWISPRYYATLMLPIVSQFCESSDIRARHAGITRLPQKFQSRSDLLGGFIGSAQLLGNI